MYRGFLVRSCSFQTSLCWFIVVKIYISLDLIRGSLKRIELISHYGIADQNCFANTFKSGRNDSKNVECGTKIEVFFGFKRLEHLD